MEELSKRIKDLRIEKGYTQSFVAGCLKIDRSNYSKYELGKLELKPQMIVDLVKLYKVSADFLLGLEDL